MNKLGRMLRPVSYVVFGIALGRIDLGFTNPTAWVLLGCMVANSIGTMMEFVD